MALYHFEVTQVKRSEGRSVVAAAAYRSGEKLHSDYYEEDADYTRKHGVVRSEILLPSHAPPEYADRETLWNAVEKAERGAKAQLAYSFDIALQNEFSMEENIALARQFVLENFVRRGMIADLCIHDPDKNGGIPNPHFHVLCPIRPLKENGEWDAKQHREYVYDSDGQPILDDAGHKKFNAVPTTDWGRPETLEEWRRKWAELCNEEFAKHGLADRIDYRSYARQGVDQIPTVHEGPNVRKMEAKGIRTEKGELNRWIKATNDLLRKIRKRIAELSDWLKEKDEQQQVPDLAQALGDYYAIRNAGAYSQKARVGNLKRYAEDFAFLESKGIRSVEQLRAYVGTQSSRVHDLNASLRQKQERMKELQTLIRLAEDFARLKPVVDAMPPKEGFWKKKREKYRTDHDSELRQYYAVKRKQNELLPDQVIRMITWKTELEQLGQEYANESAALKPIYAELKKLRELQQHVDTAIHDRDRGKRKKNLEMER